MKKLFAFVFLFIPVNAKAQVPVINPTRVEFLASPDHNTLIGTIPMLDHYELMTVRQDNISVLIFTSGLGKPTPAPPIAPATEGLIGPITVPTFLTMGANVNYVAFINTVPTVSLGLQSIKSIQSDPFVKVGNPRATGKPVVRQ